MLADKTITEFMNELASKAPAPGGGGAAALTGSIGIALGDMAGELSVGKMGSPEEEDRAASLTAEALAIKDEFLALIDADAEAFLPLARAYRIPRDDPGRSAVMEEALRRAASVPMDTMRTCARALEVIANIVDISTRLALSDAGSAAVCCRAALQAAYLSVLINTRMMADREYAEALNREAEEMLARCNSLADEVYSSVSDALRVTV